MTLLVVRIQVSKSRLRTRHKQSLLSISIGGIDHRIVHRENSVEADAVKLACLAESRTQTQSCELAGSNGFFSAALQNGNVPDNRQDTSRGGDIQVWHRVCFVVVGRFDGTAHGGHLLEARVRPTCELILTENPSHLQKKLDPKSGIALIQV